MSTALLAKLLASIGAALKPLWPYIIAAILGVLVAHYTPVFGYAGQHSRLEAKILEIRAANGKLSGQLEAEKAKSKAAEAARSADAAAAVAAIEEERKSCQSRIDHARAAATRIDRLLKEEKPYDPTVCPDRRLIDPDGLREAIG